MRKIFILMLMFSFSVSENFDELRSYIKKIENGDMNVPYEKIYSYEQIVPEHPIYLYLRGLIEIDGDKSMEYYKKIYSLDPRHEYADDATMKIGEYYYSKGLYVQSADWLKKMPQYYPRSDRAQDAVDLFLKSMIISGKKDTAMFYLQIIQNQMPNVVVNEKYLDMLKESKIDDPPEDIPQILGESYYLQIGVYRDYKNARKVRDVLNLKGFDARVEHVKSDGKKLYIVLEGLYPNKVLAQKTSDNIKKRLTYDSIIKQHD